MKEKIKIYLSASITNKENNKYICSKFNPDKFLIYLPQNITPDSISHTNFPLTVYQNCLEMMKNSDAGLILLDSYGNDSAWECGWYTNSDKFLIAFVESNSRFLRDWMIKGGIDGYITTNPRLYDIAKSDPILKYKHLNLINSIDEIEIAFLKIYKIIKN